MTTKTYVTLQPNSNTNLTTKHLVVDFYEWQAYRNGDVSCYHIASEHDTADAARTAADKLNGRA